MNYLARIQLLKKTLKAFPSGEMLAQSFKALALLLKEEPCPLKPSNGFLKLTYPSS